MCLWGRGQRKEKRRSIKKLGGQRFQEKEY